MVKMISEYYPENNKSQNHIKAILIKIKYFLKILSYKIGATVTELSERAPGGTCFTYGGVKNEK